jgi:hypothetical protein
MKKLIISAMLFLLVLVSYSQDTRFILKERTTKTGEVIVDTIWQVRKISTKINESNEIVKDTTWIKFNKNRTNLSLPSTSENLNSNYIASSKESNTIFEKGRGFIGVYGNTSVSSSLGIEGVRLGYFVADNQVLGGGGQIGFSENSGVNISAFYRSFFGKGTKGKMWGELSSNIIAADGETTFGFGLGSGYTSLLTRSCGFDIGLKYQKLGQNDGELLINFGLILLVGN